jgi:hypothetical protein
MPPTSNASSLPVSYPACSPPAKPPRFWSRSSSCDPADDRLAASSSEVFAIGFGPESDSVLLASIADATGGESTLVDVDEATGQGGGGGIAAAAELSQPLRLASAFLRALKRTRELMRLSECRGTFHPANAAIALKLEESEAEKASPNPRQRRRARIGGNRRRPIRPAGPA